MKAWSMSRPLTVLTETASGLRLLSSGSQVRILSGTPNDSQQHVCEAKCSPIKEGCQAFTTSSSDVYAPNFGRETISDEDLIRGFLLALDAGGRKEKTLHIYEESILMLSYFTRSLGLPGLATMDRTHVRHRLASLHQKGNKPATVSVRNRSLNRFFKWCVAEVERSDNPMDHVDPPRFQIPSKPATSPTMWSRS